MVKVCLFINYILIDEVKFVSQQMRCIFRCVLLTHFFIVRAISIRSGLRNGF